MRLNGEDGAGKTDCKLRVESRTKQRDRDILRRGRDRGGGREKQKQK